jgi:hypothetical protein
VSTVTSTITITCPEGLVLATDMRETTLYPPWMKKDPEIKDNVEKIYPFKNETKVAVSCWGLGEIVEGTNKTDIIPFLEAFDKAKIKKGFTVDDVANELKSKLENITPKIENCTGIHVAGYLDGKPKLRHVFHSQWHKGGEFTNEDCHKYYHLIDTGDRVAYRQEIEYPTLFNGDNFVANALFNYAPQIQPWYYLSPSELTLDDCISLAKFVIDASIQRLDYFIDSRKFKKIDPKAVGGRDSIGIITSEEGFKWVIQK